MAYFTPYIDETGLHIPSYTDTRDKIVDDYKQLFGENLYLDNDSMDYQQISILSKYIYDTYLSLQVAYSSRVPQSASGVGLDSLASLYSIERIRATKSTVSVTLTGSSGTVVNNGKVSDGTNSWLLPSVVTIPASGTITVEAESEQYGPVYVQANSITTILTPVFGWQSVTNLTASTPGVSQEPDAALRARMMQSSFVPSTTVIEGLYSALLQITGVEDAKVYENDSDTTDANGIPEHSICCVVNGGADEDIAYQIYLRKTPGCGTYGSASFTGTTFYGDQFTVNWYRPSLVTPSVSVTVQKLAGWSDAMEEKMLSAITEYINNLAIGETLYNTIVQSIAQGTAGDTTNPSFVVTSVSLTNASSNFRSKYEVSASDVLFTYS